MSRGLVKMWEAQGKCCAVCGRKMIPLTMKWPRLGWTIEHVYNRASKRFYSEGNTLISHAECNARKGDREPTGCEVILLHATNARLGYELTSRKDRSARRSRPYAAARVVYSEQIEAPSALALALQKFVAPSNNLAPHCAGGAAKL